MSPRAITFPNTTIGSTATVKVGIKNSGTAHLIEIVNTPSLPFGLSGSGSFNLAPETVTTITLTFTPTSATQAHQFDTVPSNAVNYSSVQLKLQGTGSP